MTKQQEKLLGALIGLARSVDGNGEAAKGESQDLYSGDSHGHRPDGRTHQILLEGLCGTRKDCGLAEEQVQKLKERTGKEKDRLNPDCALCKGKCGRTDDFDLEELWEEQEPERGLRLAILEELQRTASRLWKKETWTKEEKEAINRLYKGLFAIGNYVGEKRLRAVKEEVTEKWPDIDENRK